MASSSFVPPLFWGFRPFFSLQPVHSTREKQLKLWRDLIIQYHSHHRNFRMTPSSFELFRNDGIERQLSSEGIAAVIESLIKTGHAEWEDGTHANLRIMWKSPDSLANEIYDWASKSALLGNVLTVYELHAGEDNQDTSFFGIDPYILRRALAVLEIAGKCLLFNGATTEEDGVKFLAIDAP